MGKFRPSLPRSFRLYPFSHRFEAAHRAVVACILMDWISAVGTAGTLGFGILSLYQWTALTAQRRAIKAHTQTAYNNFWNVGNEMEQLLKVALDTNATLDHATVLRRSSAANSVSMAARHEVINFGRHYADFVPKYEQGWNPDPILKKPSLLKRLTGVTSRNRI